MNLAIKKLFFCSKYLLIFVRKEGVQIYSVEDLYTKQIEILDSIRFENQELSQAVRYLRNDNEKIKVVS